MCPTIVPTGGNGLRGYKAAGEGVEEEEEVAQTWRGGDLGEV